jgi:hypothetical protein
MATLVVLVACGGSGQNFTLSGPEGHFTQVGSAEQFTQAEIDAALAQLRPSYTNEEWAEAWERCALENGFVGTITHEPDGGISFQSDNRTGNDEILRSCGDQIREAFGPHPTLDDKSLELTAQYELQRLAAACVETELGLETNLPNLEAYIDSDGNWNMYDAAIAASPVEQPKGWDEWQQTCPQDLWQYHDERG